MEKRIKLNNFNEFVNEARGWGTMPSAYKTFEKNLGELPFENGISDEVFTLESRWEALEEAYWWNRESRDVRYDHFAINVKFYNWPDPDQVREVLGMNKEEISDDEIDDRFWRFVNDEREWETEDIANEYSWISATGFGGQSGGWLLIAPSESRFDQMANLEQDLDWYLEYRDFLKDQEDWPELYNKITSQNWQRLNSLGLAQIPEEMTDLMKRLNGVKATLRVANAYVDQVEAGLAHIVERANDFKQRIVNDFIEMIKDDGL